MRMFFRFWMGPECLHYPLPFIISIFAFYYVYRPPQLFINFILLRSPSSTCKELTAARLALSSFTGASQWLSEEPTEVSGETSVLLKCHGCRMGCGLYRCHRFQNWLICLFIYIPMCQGVSQKKTSMLKWSTRCAVIVSWMFG